MAEDTEYKNLTSLKITLQFVVSRAQLTESKMHTECDENKKVVWFMQHFIYIKS